MARRKVLTVTAATIVAGLTALGATSVLAAPPGPTASSSSDPQAATASAIEVPGVVSVSRAETGPNGQSWSAVSLLGDSLVGRGAAGWAGPLAALGSLADQLNAKTCGGTAPGAAQAVFFCVLLLPSAISSSTYVDGTGGSIVQAGGGTKNAEGEATGVTVGVLNAGAARVGCNTNGFASLLAVQYQLAGIGGGYHEPVAETSRSSNCPS